MKRVRGVWVIPCSSCGFMMEDASSLDEDGAAPSRGALMMCIACGALHLVDESDVIGLYMREPSADEYRRALGDPRVIRMLEVRAMLQRRAGGDWSP